MLNITCLVSQTLAPQEFGTVSPVARVLRMKISYVQMEQRDAKDDRDGLCGVCGEARVSGPDRLYLTRLFRARGMRLHDHQIVCSLEYFIHGSFSFVRPETRFYI